MTTHLPSNSTVNVPWLVLAETPTLMVIQTTTNGTPATADNVYGGFNLGTHVGDDPIQVQQNRANLLSAIGQVSPTVTRIHWLNQVHGNSVYHVTEALASEAVAADAHMTTLDNTALAIMTADCVPIMLASEDGAIIGAIHAGWQGLAKGVIGNTVQKMAHQISLDSQNLPLNQLAAVTGSWQAWVGACIAQDSYEVDSRVRNGVLASLKVDNAIADQLFRPNPAKDGHYFADLTKVAELQLNACGITNVVQSGLNSHGDARFYSYREQTQHARPATGRMATLIWRKLPTN